MERGHFSFETTGCQAPKGGLTSVEGGDGVLVLIDGKERIVGVDKCTSLDEGLVAVMPYDDLPTGATLPDGRYVSGALLDPNVLTMARRENARGRGIEMGDPAEALKMDPGEAVAELRSGRGGWSTPWWLSGKEGAR